MDKLTAPVQNLLKMAMSGDRNGCLQSIPTMSAMELNTIIDPNDNSTFLSKACTFGEVAVMEKLLKHGAVPSAAAWISGVKSGSMELIRPLASYITPANVPNAIFDLLDNKLSGNFFHQLDIIKLFLEGPNCAEWVALGKHNKEGGTSTYIHAALTSELITVAKYLTEIDGCQDFLLSLDDEGLSPLQLAETKLMSLLEKLQPSRTRSSRTRRSGSQLFSRHDWVEVPDNSAETASHASNGEPDDREEDEEDEEGSEDIGSGSISVTSSEQSGESDEDDEDEEDGEQEGGSHDEDGGSEEENSVSINPEDAGSIGHGVGGEETMQGLGDINLTEVRRMVEDLREVVLKMVDKMGLQTALNSQYGFNHRAGHRTLIKHFGVFPLLDALCADFKQSQWVAEDYEAPLLSTPSIIPTNSAPQGETHANGTDTSARTLVAEESAEMDGSSHRTNTIGEQPGTTGLHITSPGGKGPMTTEPTRKPAPAAGSAKRKNLPANVTMAITGVVNANGGDSEDDERFYTDDGFVDQSSMSAFLLICVTAARIFIESVDTELKVRQNEFLAPDGLLDLDETEHCWKLYFHGVPSCKAVRAVIWTLLSMHPVIRGKHIRAWAHIFEQLTADRVTGLEAELQLKFSTPPGQSVLQRAFLNAPLRALRECSQQGGWDVNTMFPILSEHLSRADSAMSSTPSGTTNGVDDASVQVTSIDTSQDKNKDKDKAKDVSSKKDRGKRDRRWGRRRNREDKKQQTGTPPLSTPSHPLIDKRVTMTSPTIPHSYCDPFSGLSHPAVTGLVIERMGSLGFTLLYGINGQVVNAKGEGVDDYEENALNAALELFLCVVAPRLPAVHKQVCMEKIAILEELARRKRVSEQMSSTRRGKKKRRPSQRKHRTVEQSTQRIQAHAASVMPTVQGAVLVQPVITLGDALSRLENHAVYSSSFGSVPMQQALEGGMLLYPGEHPSEKRLQLSLLRFVTSVLRNEVIGLWFDIDQMLSLLGGALDDGQRLAVVVRALYVWSVIDEASISPPSEWMRVTKRDTQARSQGWELIVGASAAEPIPKWRRAYARSGLSCSLEYIASGLNVKNVPALILGICKTRTEGIRCLLDSTAEDASDELIVSHLSFLVRTPFVLDDMQRLDYVMNCISDGIIEHDAAADGGDDGEDYEIHLNRFTDPPVWSEAVLQQLILNKDRPLTRSRLSVLYQGEAGIGPGPLKEFLEMCRVFFMPDLITNSSLTDMMTLASASGESEANQSPDPTEGVGASLTQGRSEIGGKGKGPVPLTSFFPLFRPAGESHPNCIVPLEVSEVANRVSWRETLKPAVHTELEEKSTEAKSEVTGGKRAGRSRKRGANAESGERSRKEALRTARLMFESMGVLLGYSILNCCPIGVGLPGFVWTLLLKQEIDSFGHAISRKPRSIISWQQLCGKDLGTLRSCAVILNDLTDSDFINMDMSFVGFRHVWDPVAHSLRLEECDLMAGGGSVSVTAQNKRRYVDMYARARYMSRGMEESIECMRSGLLRVIPQSLLNVLNAEHIGELIHGDALLDVESLRGHVLYDNGYSSSHRVIKLFWHLLEQELSESDKRNLLLFWTGNSIPPHGGFGGDGGDIEEMTITRMASRKPRDSLPEASTCDKRLYLPEYRSLDEMRRAIKNALEYSAIGFDRP